MQPGAAPSLKNKIGKEPTQGEGEQTPVEWLTEHMMFTAHNQSQTTRLPSGPTAWYSTAGYEVSRSTLCRAAAATANVGDGEEAGGFCGDAMAAALAAAAVLCTLFGSCDWCTDAEVTSARGKGRM